MAKRPKLYYPKSFITEGLHTEGKEWMYENGTEYIGQYHRYVDGLVMTGASYNELKSERLVPWRDIPKNPNSFTYDNIRTGEDLKKYTSPRQYLPRPQLVDYKRQYITRYFVQRRNQPRGGVIEVSAEDYETLGKKGTGINGDLYKGLEIRWKIAGNAENTIEGGVVHYGIRATNERTLNIKEPQMVGLKQFLGDPEEFSIYSKLTSAEIKKNLDI